MEKLGWGQDQRLGVDPPPYNSNPLLPPCALTHGSDLTSPASPTAPLGTLCSACAYMNICFNGLSSARPPLLSPAAASPPAVQRCAPAALQWEGSSVNEVTGMT